MKATFEEFLNGRKIKMELVDVAVGKNSIEMMDGWDVDEIDMIVGSEGKTFYSASDAVQFLENNDLLEETVKVTDVFEETKELFRQFDEAKEENGSVEYTKEGYMGSREIALTQQPYIDGPAGERPVYKASAIDQGGRQYEITWEVVDNWEEIEDEQQMVDDWDAPSEIIEY